MLPLEQYNSDELTPEAKFLTESLYLYDFFKNQNDTLVNGSILLLL